MLRATPKAGGGPVMSMIPRIKVIDVTMTTATMMMMVMVVKMVMMVHCVISILVPFSPSGPSWFFMNSGGLNCQRLHDLHSANI